MVRKKGGNTCREISSDVSRNNAPSAEDADCLGLFYVQVMVHRDNLRVNDKQDASSIQNFYFVTKLYMLWASSVPVIRSYQLYTWQLVCFMQVMWPLPRGVRLERFQPDSAAT